MDKWEPNQDFINFARSYAGCDGGIPQKSIWFCGIEYGGGTDAATPKEELLRVHVDTDAWKDGDDLFQSGFFKYGYNQKVAKLFSALHGCSTDDYQSFAIDNNLFCHAKPSHGVARAFKMNLYPMAFREVHGSTWMQYHYEATGIPTKQIYYATCDIFRSPAITSWVAKHQPRLIICTGKAFRDQFLLAFGGPDALYGDDSGDWHSVKLENRQLQTRLVNHGRTVLAVTPFLGGPSGLNSNAAIGAFGRYLGGFDAGYDRGVLHNGEKWFLKDH